jgi:hypothetical protein
MRKSNALFGLKFLKEVKLRKVRMKTCLSQLFFEIDGKSFGQNLLSFFRQRWGMGQYAYAKKMFELSLLVAFELSF